MSTNIGPKIGLQGEKAFKLQITNVKTAVSTYKAELEAAKSAIDKNETAEQKAKKTREALTTAITNQKAKIDQLKTAIEQAEASGQTSENTLNRAKTALANATTELNNMEAELKDLKVDKIEELSTAFETAGSKIKEAGDKVKDVGKTLTTTVTAPIVAAFTAATKTALDFDDGMAKVYTIADDSVVPIEDMSAALLELSSSSGKSATELAEAAYQALSAGVDTGNAAGFVSTAADLAKAGFLETSGAVDVLTTIINAYGYASEDAAGIADQLVQTQNDGKTTVDELASSMGQIIPTASALGIPLEQLNAAYVQMTKQGISTANATTYLNGMFTELADGGSDVGTILQEKTGKTFGQLMESGYTLGDVLQILSDDVDGNGEAFLNLWSNTRAGRGALSIVNGGIEEFNSEAETMTTATGNVSSALETLATPGAKARKAMTQLTNAGIEVGERFAPYVEKAATKVGELLEKWDALPASTQDNVIKFALVAAAVGPVLVVLGTLVSSVGSIVSAVGAAIPIITSIGGVITGTVLPAIGGVVVALGPVGIAIAAAAAAAVALGVLIGTHWDEIKEKASEVWGNVKDTIKGAWDSAKTTVKNAVENVKDKVSNGWESIKTATSTAWNNVKTSISTAWTNVKSNVSGAVNTVKTNVTNAWSNLKTQTSSAWGNIKSTIQSNGGGIKGIIAGAVEGYKSIWRIGFTTINTLTGGKLSSVYNTVKSKLSNVFTAVQTKLNAIKQKFTDIWDSAKNTVQTAIDNIKGLFNFSWSLPSLKMPHFSWSWYDVGGIVKLPKISVSWYKRAYTDPILFNSPTVLSTAGGLKGFGDGRGGEVVIGQSMMYSMIRDAVSEGGGGGMTEIHVTVNPSPGMDERALADLVADRIADRVNRRRAAFA